MSAILWTDVEGIAPELSAVPVAGQTMILAHVNDVVTEVQWGGDAASPTLKMARVYYAAHMGVTTFLGSDGPSGPLTAEKAGGLSSSYAAPAISDSLLDSSPYGKILRTLIRQNPWARGPQLP